MPGRKKGKGKSLPKAASEPTFRPLETTEGLSQPSTSNENYFLEDGYHRELEFMRQQLGRYNIINYAKEISCLVLIMIYPDNSPDILKSIPAEFLPSDVSIFYNYLFESARVMITSRIQENLSLEVEDVRHALFHHVIFKRFLTQLQREFVLNCYNLTKFNEPQYLWQHNCFSIYEDCVIRIVTLGCGHKLIEFRCGHTLIKYNCDHIVLCNDDVIKQYFAHHICPEIKVPSTRISKFGCHYESTMQPCDIFVRAQFPCGYVTLLPCQRLVKFHESTYFYPEPENDYSSYASNPILVTLTDD